MVNGEKRRKFLNTGDAKSLGVAMYFELTKEPKNISLTILDDKNMVVRQYSKDDMRLNTVDAASPSFNSGLNKFVWNMRYDAIDFIGIQPIAAPGKYTAKLTVDGVVQSSSFTLSISPHESYSKKQLQAKKKFWMELYNTAKANTQKIKKALATKEDVLAKAESAKGAQAQADEVARIVDEYKAVYIPKGRTLAEIINQPAKINSKMVWLHNMAELSEGPATQSMKDQFAEIKKVMTAEDATYEKNMKKALAKFEKATR
jgi:hypothetical protein